MNQTQQASDEQTNVEAPTTQEGTEQTQEASVKPQQSQEVDYKKKFQDSSRGAQQLLDRYKELEADKLRLEEQLANQTRISPEIAQPIAQENSQPQPWIDPETAMYLKRAADREKFEQDFSKAVSRYPQLFAHRDDFKIFAYKPENLETPLLQLAAEYILEKGLYSQEEAQPEPQEEPSLEQGVGGDRQAPPKEGYSPNEARHIRETDPRKYNRLVREGKMKIKQ